MPGSFLRLGELLVAKGVISNLQLSIALAAQRSSRRRLGEILVDRGYATEAEIAGCLAAQYGYEVLDPAEIQPESDALKLIEPEIALTAELLPIEAEGNVLRCLVADPIDITWTDRIAQATGMRLSLSIAPRSALVNAIRNWYRLDPERAIGAAAPGIPKLPERYSLVRTCFAIDSATLIVARDNSLDRLVSMLFVPDGSQSKRAEMIRWSAKANAPGLAAVHDWLETENGGWAIFEHLEGETLENVLSTRGKRSPAQAAEIVIEIAEGADVLDVASGKCGFICPQNVVMLDSNRHVLAPLAIPPDSYIAPELHEGMQPNTASDVFALGVLLFHAATGTNPFDYPTAEQTQNAMMHGLKSDAPELPSAMVNLVRRCVHPEPSFRLSSPLQLSLALRSCSWPTTVQREFVPPAYSSEDRDLLLDSVTAGYVPEQKPSFWERLFGKRAA